MKKIVILLILVTVTTVMGYFFIQKENLLQVESMEKVNRDLFHFRSVKGETFTIKGSEKKFYIDEIKNKIVFLKVFGWKCTFCEKEIPQLIKLKEQFSSAFDVIALESQGHSRRENLEKIEQYGVNYPIVSGEGQEAFYAYLKREYNWLGIIPLTIIVGENGEVLAFEEGFKSYSLAGLLKMALLERKKSKMRE